MKTITLAIIILIVVTLTNCNNSFYHHPKINTGGQIFLSQDSQPEYHEDEGGIGYDPIPEKPKGIIRILCVGDSITWG